MSGKDTDRYDGAAVIETPKATPVMPADYYRRHAARLRQLASDATTPAVKENLRETAAEYDRLAERAEAATPSPGDAK